MSFRGQLIKAGITTNGSVMALGTAAVNGVKLSIGAGVKGINFAGLISGQVIDYTTVTSVGDTTSAHLIRYGTSSAEIIYTPTVGGSHSGIQMYITSDDCRSGLSLAAIRARVTLTGTTKATAYGGQFWVKISTEDVLGYTGDYQGGHPDAIIGVIEIPTSAVVISSSIYATMTGVTGEVRPILGTVTQTGTICAVRALVQSTATNIVSGTLAGLMVQTTAAGTVDVGVLVQPHIGSTITKGIHIDTVYGTITTGISIAGVTGDAISITGSGFFKLGVFGTGIPVTSTANQMHTMEVHTKPAVVFDAWTSSFGIRSRYEITTAQTLSAELSITIHAIDGRLRIKDSLKTGIYAGVCGYVETSDTWTFDGSADSVIAAGLFTVEMDNTATLNTGRVIGVGIDSATAGDEDVSGVTYTGLRIWVGSSKEPWTYGITVDDCVTGISVTVDSAITTTGISITGTMYGATARAIKSGISVTAPAHGDGYAAHDFTLSHTSGANTDAYSCLGAWINIVGPTVLSGSIVSAANTGLYSNGSTLTGAHLVFGMRMQADLSSGGFSTLCPFSLNTGATAITALFHCGSMISEIGYIAIASTNGSKEGVVPFMVDSGGTIHYVRIYDAADAA